MTLAPILADSLDGITHGFFTRQGGVSTGIYAALNGGQGSQDTSAAVDENRARIVRHLGVERLVSVYQVHGDRVEVVCGAWQGARPRADAMVTGRAGIGLAIFAPLMIRAGNPRNRTAACCSQRPSQAVNTPPRPSEPPVDRQRRVRKSFI